MGEHYVAFRVSGREQVVEARLWRHLRGPKPLPLFACDGCSWSPDRIFGRMIWPACVVHDYHYRSDVLGGTWHGRRLADRTFRSNVYTALRDQGASSWWARHVARLYYGRVRLWGASSYTWDSGEKPTGLVQRAREAYGSWKPTQDAAAFADAALRRAGRLTQ